MPTMDGNPHVSAVFLDRDGVINRKAEEGKYITSWDQVEILPGVPQAIALLNQAGYRVVIATNQRCVAKGFITIDELQQLHARLLERLARDGANIDGIYCCPHDNVPPCGCRKPAPGLLLNAAVDLRLSLPSSWMIGDSESDIEAGRNAGCRTVHVCGDGRMSTVPADLVAKTLLDAAQQILGSRCEVSRAVQSAIE